MEDGHWSKRPAHTYPHILPPGSERLAFYEPLADEIFSYCTDANIALHSEILNLKSSQAACFNFLFPLRQDAALAKHVLRRLLPGLREVTTIEFEYTGPEGTTAWLGEPKRGQRGRNRTSIDAAVFWIGRRKRRHVTLIEWKYTERSFGSCSAYDNAPPVGKQRCRSLDVATASAPARLCLLTSGGDRRSRRYWEHMGTAGISLPAFEGVRECPFRGPFYQLMRQFLVAAFLRQSGEADEVDIASIGFARNTHMHRVWKPLQPLMQADHWTIIDVWNSVLRGIPPMRHWTVEQLMERVNRIDGIDLGWRNYLRERYDV